MLKVRALRRLLLATGARALVSGLLLAGCASPQVIRVIDGREVTGRFVSPEAYALYARGADAEARGDLAGARVHYLAAAEEDGQNIEIWTRIGAVTCALGRRDDAQSAFTQAAAKADDYEPLFRERAICALTGTPTEASATTAFEDAKRALALDPQSEDAVLLYARSAEASGQPELAERALRELAAHAPGRAAGWRALRDLAKRRGNQAAEARASAALLALADASKGEGATGESAARKPLSEVDLALSRDALDEARSAAKRARLPPAELAVRAAALGRVQIAKAQAELVHKADPSNGSAALALAVACDLLGDQGGVGSALADPGGLTTPPSLLARLLFAELIARRTDTIAARAWLGPDVKPAEPDPLVETVAGRVAQRLNP